MRASATENILTGLKAHYKGDPSGISSDVLELSKYIVAKSTIDNKPVTNDQLQTILYILQKQALTYASLPIHNGVFEAWDIGPVVRPVHNHFLPSGYLKSFCGNTEEIKGKDFIDFVVTEFQEMRPLQMSKEAKKNGGAWAKIWAGGEGKNKEIPLFLIRRNG